MENMVGNRVVAGGVTSEPSERLFSFTWENRLYSQVWRVKKRRSGESEGTAVSRGSGLGGTDGTGNTHGGTSFALVQLLLGGSRYT